MKKFDKTFGATGQGLRQGHRRPHDRRHREAPAGPVELPVHRGHVVPGPLQLRLPPHGALHHPVRDAGRRDQLLRLQHGHRLAEHHREDAHDRHADQVVRGARPPRDLRGRQEGGARHHRAHAQARRRGRRRRASRRIWTRRASPRPRAKKSSARARPSRRTSAWPSSTGRSCSRKPKPELATGLQIQGLGKKKTEGETVTH